MESVAFHLSRGSQFLYNSPHRFSVSMLDTANALAWQFQQGIVRAMFRPK